MKAILQKPGTEIARDLVFAGLILAILGMVSSPALLSLGTLLIILPAFFLAPPGELWHRFRTHTPAVLFSLLFLLNVLSILYTENTSNWAIQIRIKAPLMFIPFSLAVLGPLGGRRLSYTLWTWVGASFIVGLGTVIKYYAQADEINESIIASKPVRTLFGEVNHIYFSIILAISIFAGLWLWLQKKPVLFSWEPKIALVITLANLIFLHIITTRTGLLSFYAGAFGLAIYYTLSHRQWIRGLLILLLLTAIPLTAYYALPSLRNRVNNTMVDLKKYQGSENPNFYSISTRFHAWQTALQVIIDHPVLGVGPGDLRDEMNKKYEENGSLLLPEQREMPHNQYLQTIAGLGLPGGMVLLFILLFPVYRFRKPKPSWLFISLWIILVSSMMVESVLERQLGVIIVTTTWMLTLSPGVNPPPESVDKPELS